ncbi:magnesium chelatase ATPase subunit D [Thioflavicoccus mobilis 8321]|uniref:Mg-protoporphyrin IX chelatase n=1 Tax=Thioflavicoccus mobilis 8321 TaxID=765912 RepID=L0H227_9GAMM|nr:magnesium chelatase subunit D [Thioflavicoccus mobilis]AGA91705.1 magnesium chelatase ATPase subunit D [Thioflavicoccus mobilis 8321]
MSDGAPEVSRWDDATLAAALLAIDPIGIGGVALRALAGPVRERWLELVRELLPEGMPLRRVPLHVTDGRLLGGLDLAATLRSGRPVAERGLLVESDGGVVVLAMAERVSPTTAARLTAALDMGEVVLERDGLALRTPARFGVIALDEGVADDERLPTALLDRLAIPLDLTEIAAREAIGSLYDADDVAAARERLAHVEASDQAIESLCGASLTLGIGSLRASLQGLRVARVAAALAGRDQVTDADLAVAGRLVLAPRATVLPMTEPPPDQESPEPPPPPEDEPPSNEDQAEQESTIDEETLTDLILEAAKAAMPEHLLAQLAMAGRSRGRSRSSGKAGMVQQGSLRGRPAGVRRGEPRAGARMNVVETLRSAAPWQRVRRAESRAQPQSQGRPRVEVRAEDFRITRYKQRSETTTIFAVDASGSSALHRLAEAKGAVELLLADCYVRRDRVALIAFRGREAELLLPPTRSLVRAKRSLAGLPGGGGTPLAAGLDAAVALADGVRRRGGTPVLVLLTDGRANIARDGTGGRARAEEEAMVSARLVRAAELTALLVDTSPRPQDKAAQLAGEMGATYLPLPYADAGVVSRAVQAAGQG